MFLPLYTAVIMDIFIKMGGWDIGEVKKLRSSEEQRLSFKSRTYRISSPLCRPDPYAVTTDAFMNRLISLSYDYELPTKNQSQKDSIALFVFLQMEGMRIQGSHVYRVQPGNPSNQAQPFLQSF